MKASKKKTPLPLMIGAIAAAVLVVVSVILLLKQSNSLLRDGSEPLSELSSSPSEEISEEPSEESSEESSEKSSVESEPESSEGAGKSEMSEESSRESEQSSEEEASQTEPPQSSASATEYDEVDTSGYTYPDRVPASAEVDNSWFDDALFIGDSITEGIKAYNLLGNATVVSNVGISLYNVATKECINTGDGTRITIPQAVAQYPNKTKIYIQLGVNGMGMTIDQFKQAYSGFIDIIRKSHPNASIYLVSIFPISEQKFYNSGYSKSITNAKIDEFNNAIMEVAVDKDAHFLYVAECIKQPDGSLDAEVTGDGMHIGPAYYERWFQYMREHTA